MNFSEFKKLIGADPWNRDSETLRARDSSPEFEAAAVEAEEFEEKLQSALNIQPPASLIDEIKGISAQPSRQRRWMPMALAASVLIAVGSAGMVWKQSRQWDSIEDYLVDHYSHDGPALVERATSTIATQEIERIMARLDAEAGQQLAGNIQFIKWCPTPDGRGAHMVVSTNSGPMTVIFMPKTPVNDGEIIEFEQMYALLISLEHGSAAIVANQSQDANNLAPVIKSSLKTGLVKT